MNRQQHARSISFWTVAILIVGLLLSRGVRAGDEPKHYAFGVVPQQSASKLASIWAPFLRRLGETAGMRISFATAKDIPTFESRLKNGEYDLAYMNPYHYATLFSKHPGYRAFAKEKGKHIQGIVVCPMYSQYKKLSDLRGSALAFPSPFAFAASMLPRAHLKKEGIDFTPKYVKSHDSVYRAVAKGICPAGGGIKRTYYATESDIRIKLRILWVSGKYSPHVFAAHPRVPDTDVKRIVKTMTDMNTDKDAFKILNNLNLTGFEPAADADWNDVRTMDFSLIKD